MAALLLLPSRTYLQPLFVFVFVDFEEQRQTSRPPPRRRTYRLEESEILTYFCGISEKVREFWEF